MTATYRLSDAAQRSLDDIFIYTYDQWGEEQAKCYISDLFALFETITKGEEKGRLIQPQYGVTGYYARCGKHFVYWKIEADGKIAIVEILHERMNIGDHLQEQA